MNVGYLITGRLKSTRLRKKIFLKVLGKHLLFFMINQIRASKQTKSIILCTSTNSEDNPLEEFAKQEGIKCFRGDEDDVITRLYEAASYFELDYVLNMTADCPLIDPLYVDKVVDAFIKTDADMILPRDLPHGSFTYGVKPSAMKKVIQLKDTKDTEVWPVYITDTGLFNTYNLPIPNKHNRPDIRLTLDYPEDFEILKILIENLYEENKAIKIDKIINYLNSHPEIAAINKDCAQKYKKNITKQTFIKLKSEYL